MNDSDLSSVAYILALIVTLAVIGPSIPFGPDDAIINPFSCIVLEGTVVDKEHEEGGGYKLYVDVYVDSWEGYIVFVSNTTYNNYEVGYTYEQTVCDLVEYEDIKSMYFDLIDIGVLIPT